jgi:hypothetical protein
MTSSKEDHSPSVLLALERWFGRKHLKPKSSAQEDLDLSNLSAEDAELVSTVMRQHAENGGQISSLHKARMAWPCAFCRMPIPRGDPYVTLNLLPSPNERYCVPCAKRERLMPTA